MTTARIISERRVCLPGIEAAEPGARFEAVLPWPPTTNTYYRSLVIKGRVRVLLSDDARRYQRDVAGVVGRLRKAGKAKPLTGPLSFAVVVCPPEDRRLDIDNRLKALFDACMKAGVFADDSQIRDLHAAFGPVVEGGEVRVRIAPLAEAPRLIPAALLESLLVRIGVMCDLLTRECR